MDEPVFVGGTIRWTHGMRADVLEPVAEHLSEVEIQELVLEGHPVCSTRLGCESDRSPFVGAEEGVEIRGGLFSLRRACEELAGTPVNDAEVHGHEGVRFAFPMEDALSDLGR